MGLMGVGVLRLVFASRREMSMPGVQVRQGLEGE